MENEALNEAVRQAQDHLVHTGALGCGDDFLGIDFTETGDVFADRPAEKFNVLR